MKNSIRNVLMRATAVGVGVTTLFAAAIYMGGALIARAQSEPVISSVSAAPSATGATISWTTDEGANAQVAYGTSLPYTASSTLDSTMLANHAVTLTGLTPSTMYHYEVISTDGSNNTNMSPDQTFTTAASNTLLTLSAASGAPGTSFTVTGSGFTPLETITLTFNGTPLIIAADQSGGFSQMLTVPTSASGNLTISASGASSGMTETATFTAVAPVTAFVSLDTYSGAPGTTVTVTGNNFNPSETVDLTFGSVTVSTPADTNGNFTTTLTVPSAAVGSLTLTAIGVTSSRVATNSFYVEPTTTTTAATTTDVTTLQNEITQLQSEVSALQSQAQTLMNQSATPSTSSSTGTSATLDPEGPVTAGTSVDFGGRNWGSEEPVQVTMDGNLITTAHADGGGNFTTGSLSVPSTPGAYTYTFTGMNSGITQSETLTVQ